MKTIYRHTAVAMGCVKQQGYSLIKNKLYIVIVEGKQIEIYKGVGCIGPFFAIRITRLEVAELD